MIGLLRYTRVATVTVSDVTTRFSTIFMLTAGLRWQDTDKREERLEGTFLRILTKCCQEMWMSSTLIPSTGIRWPPCCCVIDSNLSVVAKFAEYIRTLALPEFSINLKSTFHPTVVA